MNWLPTGVSRDHGSSEPRWAIARRHSRASPAYRIRFTLHILRRGLHPCSAAAISTTPSSRSSSPTGRSEHPDFVRLSSHRDERRGTRHPPADDRTQSGRGAPRDLDRRQHARVRGVRFQRRARDRRRCAEPPSRRKTAMSAPLSAAHGRCGQGLALLHRPAHIAGRSGGGADEGPLRALEPGERPREQGPRLLGVRRHRRRRHDGLHAPAEPGRRVGGTSRR